MKRWLIFDLSKPERSSSRLFIVKQGNSPKHLPSHYTDWSMRYQLPSEAFKWIAFWQRYGTDSITKAKNKLACFSLFFFSSQTKPREESLWLRFPRIGIKVTPSLSSLLISSQIPASVVSRLKCLAPCELLPVARVGEPADMPPLSR